MYIFGMDFGINSGYNTTLPVHDTYLYARYSCVPVYTYMKTSTLKTSNIQVVWYSRPKWSFHIYCTYIVIAYTVHIDKQGTTVTGIRDRRNLSGKTKSKKCYYK